MTLRRGALTLDTIVDDSVTQNACNVGKSRTPSIDIRGIFLEGFRLTAGEFYPELAQVGKNVIEEEGKCKTSPSDVSWCGPFSF
jgi:hypothetical protein